MGSCVRTDTMMKHLQAITSASETDSLFICIYMGGTPGHMQVNLCMQGHRSEIFASNNISFWSPSLKIESGFWAPISLGTDKSEGQQKVLNCFHTCLPPSTICSETQMLHVLFTLPSRFDIFITFSPNPDSHLSCFQNTNMTLILVVFYTFCVKYHCHITDYTIAIV